MWAFRKELYTMTSIRQPGTIPSRRCTGRNEARGAFCFRAPHDVAGAAEGKVWLVEHSNGRAVVTLELEARSHALVALYSRAQRPFTPPPRSSQTFRANLCYSPTAPKSDLSDFLFSILASLAWMSLTSGLPNNVQ